MLYYLLGAAALKGQVNRTFDIGCRQVLSYAGMMKKYAAEAGLPHRVVLALPSDPDWAGHTVFVDDRTYRADVDPAMCGPSSRASEAGTAGTPCPSRSRCGAGWTSSPVLSVEPDGAGCRYRQRAIFFPKGLSGRLYWLAVLPFHRLIFPVMSRSITAAAQKLASAEEAPGTP